MESCGSGGSCAYAGCESHVSAKDFALCEVGLGASGEGLLHRVYALVLVTGLCPH